MKVNEDKFTIQIDGRDAVVPAYHRRVIDEENNHYTTTNKRIGFALPGGGYTQDLLNPTLSNFLDHIELVKDEHRYTCKFVNPHSREV